MEFTRLVCSWFQRHIAPSSRKRRGYARSVAFVAAVGAALVVGPAAIWALPNVAVIGAPSTASWNPEVQAKLAATGQFATVTAGYDFAVASKVVAGVFADFDLSRMSNDSLFTLMPFEHERAWSLGARLGYLASPAMLWYGFGGYTQSTFDFDVVVELRNDVNASETLRDVERLILLLFRDVAEQNALHACERASRFFLSQ